MAPVIARNTSADENDPVDVGAALSPKGGLPTYVRSSMKSLVSVAAALILGGCYGSVPPEPPCLESPPSDGVVTQIRVNRDMSRRPRQVWHVRQDSSGSWIRHGRAVHYFLNGQPSAIEWYRDGKLHGKASYWHENGALQGEIEYTDGRADGIAKTWYDNGRIESERPWKEGRLFGTERGFDRRGKLVREKTWPARTGSDSLPEVR